MALAFDLRVVGVTFGTILKDAGWQVSRVLKTDIPRGVIDCHRHMQPYIEVYCFQAQRSKIEGAPRDVRIRFYGDTMQMTEEHDTASVKVFWDAIQQLEGLRDSGGFSFDNLQRKPAHQIATALLLLNRAMCS